MVSVAEITTVPTPGSPVAVGVTDGLVPSVGTGEGVTVNEGVGEGVLVDEAVAVDVRAAAVEAIEPPDSAALTVGRSVQVGDGLGVTLGDAVGELGGVVVDNATGVGFVPQLERRTERISKSPTTRKYNCLACNPRFIDWFFILATSIYFPTQKSQKIRSTRSSLAVWPVISPSIRTAADRSIDTRSGTTPE